MRTLRRVVLYALAAIGGLVVAGSLVGFAVSRFADPATGVVLGPDKKPLRDVPVFLDRGTRAIERVLTDSAGRFRFTLSRDEERYAVWLICAPGALPMTGRRAVQIGPTTYMYTTRDPGFHSDYRGFGWHAPIPRECPPQDPRDVVGWRYVPNEPMEPHRVFVEEPDWNVPDTLVPR